MVMSRQRRSYTPEYKDQIARVVVEESRAIPSTAREIGVNEQTLRNWVNAYRQAHAGEEPPLAISERARLRELEKEVRELSSWEKPPRSSPASIGRSSVRAHRRGETRLRAGRPAQVHRRADV
jgi:transposase